MCNDAATCFSSRLCRLTTRDTTHCTHPGPSNHSDSSQNYLGKTQRHYTMYTGHSTQEMQHPKQAVAAQSRLTAAKLLAELVCLHRAADVQPLMRRLSSDGLVIACECWRKQPIQDSLHSV